MHCSITFDPLLANLLLQPFYLQTLTAAVTEFIKLQFIFTLQKQVITTTSTQDIHRTHAAMFIDVYLCNMCLLCVNIQYI